MRYFIEVAYHGQAYHGWQIQPNAQTVQARIQEAICQLLGQQLEIVGSGRTDRGVHARQQFFHIDLPETTDLPSFVHSLNGILPSDIAIFNYFKVSGQAHARFDAELRSYEYHICKRKNPFENDQCYHYSPLLQVNLMNDACRKMLKHQNFQCFSKVKTSVSNFKCNLSEAVWRENNEKLIFYVSANRFLRGMVRAMVGTMIELGLERMTMEEFAQVLDGNNRSLAGPSVPAHGLFLTKVRYPHSVFKS